MNSRPPDAPQVPRGRRPAAGLLLAALLFALCTGCSSFDSHWKAAANSTSQERWEGRWTSEKHKTSSGSPMGGRLRAVTEHAPNGGLVTQFRANWLIFASDYVITLSPKGRSSGGERARQYSGTHELPKMFGGTYRYEARMEGNRLNARYTSSYDHGTFALERLSR